MERDRHRRRLETTHEEARSVLEAQNETVSDIDDKAISTVRVAALVLGVLASAVELLGAAFHPVLLAFGGGSLLGAIGVGVLTYGESDLYIGPGRAYLDQLRRDEFGGTTWEQNLLATYGEWIESNGRVVRFNGRLLLAAQGLLVVGLVCLVAAVDF